MAQRIIRIIIRHFVIAGIGLMYKLPKNVKMLLITKTDNGIDAVCLPLGY